MLKGKTIWDEEGKFTFYNFNGSSVDDLCMVIINRPDRDNFPCSLELIEVKQTKKYDILKNKGTVE